MSQIDRRAFTGLMLALSTSPLASAQASNSEPIVPRPAVPPAPGPPGEDPKPKQTELKQLTSGTFSPGPGYGSLPKRISHRYLIGMLKAGDTRLEMHETIQEPGALHEPVDTHLHNEIWLVQRGTAALSINGVEHRMEAGDVGLVCAGDKHWVRNIGTTELAYFVVTLGPPEP